MGLREPSSLLSTSPGPREAGSCRVPFTLSDSAYGRLCRDLARVGCSGSCEGPAREMMAVDGRDASTSVGRADPRLGLCGQANAAATTRKLQGGLLLHEAWRSASGAQTNRQDSLARDEQGILGIACLFKINSGSYRSHSGRRHLPQGTGCGFDRDSFAREKVAGIFANSLRSPSSLPSRCPVRARTLEARDFGSLSNPGS